LIILLTIFLVIPRAVFADSASCEDLRVVSGNNTFVPATVTFASRATDPGATFTYYFGDGTSENSTAAQVVHTYTVSGAHTAQVQVNNSSCQAIFSLIESPFESQKSGCSNVFIIGGNSAPAGSDVKFLVTGFENKAGIKSYRIDFGNGQIKTDNVGNFDLTFPNPGTFTINGYITDSKGVEKGGTGECSVPLYITGAPIAVQPDTGTPTWITVAGIISGLCLLYIAQKHLSRR